MRGEIRIPVPEVPKNCGGCGYRQAKNWTEAMLCVPGSYRCSKTGAVVDHLLHEPKRPPFCPIVVLDDGGELAGVEV
jgi:hypothetical protein